MKRLQWYKRGAAYNSSASGLRFRYSSTYALRIDAGVGISCFMAFILVIPVCILFANFVFRSKTANETANDDFLILLYFTLLALLSSVFKNAFSSTNSACRRDTLALFFFQAISAIVVFRPDQPSLTASSS